MAAQFLRSVHKAAVKFINQKKKLHRGQVAMSVVIHQEWCGGEKTNFTELFSLESRKTTPEGRRKTKDAPA